MAVDMDMLSPGEGAVAVKVEFIFSDYIYGEDIELDEGEASVESEYCMEVEVAKEYGEETGYLCYVGAWILLG